MVPPLPLYSHFCNVSVHPTLESSFAVFFDWQMCWHDIVQLLSLHFKRLCIFCFQVLGKSCYNVKKLYTCWRMTILHGAETNHSKWKIIGKPTPLSSPQMNTSKQSIPEKTAENQPTELSPYCWHTEIKLILLQVTMFGNDFIYSNRWLRHSIGSCLSYNNIPLVKSNHMTNSRVKK